MKSNLVVSMGFVFGFAALCGYGAAQAPVVPPQNQGGSPPSATAPLVYSGPVAVDWTPPAFDYLSGRASMKESFTLDRGMLAAAATTLPESDADVRQVINRLDGVSVRLLRFPEGTIDEYAVASVRAAYHLRGWKHLATTTDAGGPVRDDNTDVWLVLDGVNVRGAVVLAETPKSLTLVTVAGNISPVDLLHLRGRFGIPRFDGELLGNMEIERR